MYFGVSQILSLLGYCFTLSLFLILFYEIFAGLKLGTKCSSITSRVLRDILRAIFSFLFVNEAAEAADVDIFSTGHVLLDYTKKASTEAVTSACLHLSFRQFR